MKFGRWRLWRPEKTMIRRQMELGAPVKNLLLPESDEVRIDLDAVSYPTTNKKRRYKQQLESLFQRISKLLKKITPKGQQNAIRTILGTLSAAEQRITLNFTIQELMTATKSFEEQLEDMGDSGFTVYRGNLRDMRPVIIKLCTERKDENLLLNELNSILSVRHRNILNLVGLCNDGEKLMLVYNYMANGNLHKMLFDPAKKKVLDWPTRLKILLGVISAIAYIHHGLQTCIVHRNIKPSSILLDEDFNPRISNFTIATPLRTANSFSDTAQPALQSSPISILAGTIGYIAPDYLQNGNLTEKVDINSFGIVALEVVSGRKCGENTPNEEDFDLRSLALRLEREDLLEELEDPRLMEGRGYCLQIF